MKPIGPLMTEHRLIERMLTVMRQEVSSIEVHLRIDPVVIEAMVDFMQFYADRTHHGKEENILFQELAPKEMASEDRQMMQGLMEEHQYARSLTNEMAKASGRYMKGEQAALRDIATQLRALIGFYPAHIRREDQTFFPAAMGYLTQDEQDAMLEEMREFDRKMIHEKYNALVEELEKLRMAALR